MKTNTQINQTAHDIVKEFNADNKRFMNTHPRSWFEQFAQKQDPRVTLITCSDSRVQLEAFDQSAQNNTFVIRNIGNQLLLNHGSVFFGIQYLKTPVLVIMGHSGCGAVEAALSNVNVLEPELKRELENIKVNKDSSLPDAVIQNIHNQVEKALSRFSKQVASNELTIIGMVYDFKNDYGHGYGKILLINVNGSEDAQQLKNIFPESNML